MQSIRSYDFSGKRALIRVDFNVPLNADLRVTDSTRIRESAPTIKHILKTGGSIVLMSHLGRPDGVEEKYSLKHIVPAVEKELGVKIIFAGDCIGETAFSVTSALKPGEVVLLENLRFYKQETKGDEAFSEQLARHGDVFVNDAFGTAHRAHASTTIIARSFPNDKMFGFLIENEIESVNKVLHHGEKPVTAIVGGAKVSSKISIIANLLDKIDNLLIGGGMVYTFLKAKNGFIGKSLVEPDHFNTALDILEQADKKGVRVMLPEDTLAADAFDNHANTMVCASHEIPTDYMGLDIGPVAQRHFALCIENSRTILWNGPVGVFEMSAFEGGTRHMAYAIVRATETGAFTMVGGGDSVAAINKFNLANHVSHVSTGGGAMLEYLEGKELPGIKAITHAY
jgi:phosphoglycerate kinase